MSDEPDTFSARGRIMARDIDALRQRYLEHRQLLEKLAADAPTEVLAQRYRQVSAEIEASIQKLAELERGIEGEPPSVVPPAPAPERIEELGPRRTAPGVRPLRTDPQTIPVSPVVPVESTGARTILILGVGVLVLAILGYFVWQFATGGDEEAPTSQNVTATNTATQPVAPPVKATLAVEPLTQDYGTVRRGSRATRQFELLNNTDQPLTIKAQRSQCRCLWYEFADTIPPQGSTTMTVTVDGSKAKLGPLHETVQVVSKTDPTVSTTFEVVAQIR